MEWIPPALEESRPSREPAVFKEGVSVQALGRPPGERYVGATRRVAPTEARGRGPERIQGGMFPTPKKSRFTGYALQHPPVNAYRMPYP
jgi:hypothetical protein